MENEPEKPVENTTHAEEIVKEELEREHKERAKAGRLLRFSLAQTAGVGIMLILGLAVLAYVLSMSYVLAGIIGGAGAVALTIFLIMSPMGRVTKHE
jgi:hypothetical protein